MTEHLSESAYVLHPEVEHHFTLTELEVILYSLRKFTPQETADAKEVSVKDIYFHRSRIIEKSDAETYEGALISVLEGGIYSRVHAFK